MTTPLTITFTKTTTSPWLERDITARVERLRTSSLDLLSCRVVVDIPHRRHQHGNRFSIRIELAVPGGDLAVTRDANLHATAKNLDESTWSKRLDVEAARRDVRRVLGDAFDAATRQLRDHAQIRRREVKRHSALTRGFAAAPDGARRPAGRMGRRPAVLP
jgi:hypothetical protein